MQWCKFLASKRVCPHGCSEVHGQQTIMCHRFDRGRCRTPAGNCPHGMHYLPQPRYKRANTTSTQPRGDGFRPHLPDTAMEIQLKKHLGVLMLSGKCEELLDLDVDTLGRWYRSLTLKRHPDKGCHGGSHERMVDLRNAYEYVRGRLPFSMTVS